jgi:hypothetical protein
LVTYVTVAGQPEYTNEDMEEELTEVRPLDIPLHLLQLDTAEDVEQQRYGTGTARTFKEAGFEGPTTVTSGMAELKLRKELEDNTKAGSDWDVDDESYDTVTVEAEHSGDGSHLSRTGGSTTEKYTENKSDTGKVDNAVDNDENEDDDDDDDDGDDDDDNSEDSDDEEREGNGDDESEYEDNKDDDEDESESEDSTKLNSSANTENNRRVYEKKNEEQIKSAESKLKTWKTSRDFEDSVEHGRQWKEEDSGSVSTPASKSGSEWSILTTTNSPGKSRAALERDLAKFLRNGSPEAEDSEARNITKRLRKEKNDTIKKKHGKSDEAEVDTVLKLQRIRELGKKANISQKVR